MMQLLEKLQLFVEQGGSVIWVVFATCLLMWLLIVERFWFLNVIYPRRCQIIVDDWLLRSDRQSWQALKVREAIVSESSLQLHALLQLIETLIMLCPMLGLLGTVTGMISVFEVIGFNGSNDAQSMAQGVYRATIPTMAGLVVALSGLYFSVQLKESADREAKKLLDRLTLN